MKARMTKREDGGHGNRLLILESESKSDQRALIDFQKQFNEKQYWKSVCEGGLCLSIDIDWDND